MGWFPQSWENWTRFDSNGDGIIGNRSRVLGRYYRNPGAYNTNNWTAGFEKWTGRDINGDGFVGNPHAVAYAHRTGGNPYAMPGPYGPPPPVGYAPGGPLPIQPYQPGFWGYIGYGVGIATAPFQIAGSIIQSGLGIVKSVVSGIKKLF